MKRKSKLQLQKDKCVKVATEIKLDLYPFCTFCPHSAITCHHFIHQSRSNYLRTAPENLVPICKACHHKLHHGGYEQIMTGKLIQKWGQEWFDKIEADSHITIKDNLQYWKDKYGALILL